ncbi:NAD(P)H-dependent oxidoreductase [Streptomyces sp. DG2A-72]|uniref:FMN-dependent NADH-azoreductase n=1 Tax=Streptomyces sp. DG2A-72 TaxID=3051386 RepID=UPI00265BE0A0|nr:NAD(P)H-dependent oxidoreductase [Streptomyces sp. DG2A-72]MDO0937293.1 NAD(P)H-dependent oxidoreductase [Streptomyces sp. DG2A-72]
MPTLLHLDTSPRLGSTTRRVTAEFAASWRAAHPDGTHIYRDLAANSVPHVDAQQIAVMHRLESAAERDLDLALMAPNTPEEKESWAICWELIEEVRAAETLLLGLPMHNFSLPSTFKAWFDRIVIPPLVVDPETGTGPLAGKQVVVVTARGGAYGPGTPRHAFDFQEPYLKAAFGMVALADDLTFLRAEMTKSGHVPRLAGFQQLAASSLKEALEGARRHAQRVRV